MLPVRVLWHKTWLAMAFTVGMGFTVIENGKGIPVHVSPEPVNAGVVVMVATMGAVERLRAVKAGISPVPPAASPMAVLLFVHE